MKFYCFHFLPYLHLEDMKRRDEYRSAWINFPNDYFEGEKCAALYERYLDELELADQMGLDGVCVNEHHQTPHSLMPSPNLIAAALTQRVRKGKILVLGRALPLANPLSVAEEFAMLDNMSRGRLITGFVRGIGAEYHVAGVNPAESHGRFREAHDLILAAWTKTGPFPFKGKYYDFPYVNILPRPFQNPHPPVWLPSTGSRETVEWAAHPDRGYTYLQFFGPYAVVKKNLLSYKDAARRHDYEPGADKLGWSVPTYVAETDEIAIREARPHIEAFFNKFTALTPEMLLPPGYTSAESIAQLMRDKGKALAGPANHTIESLMAADVIMVGSPATIREKIERAHSEIGHGHHIAMLHFGTMPGDITRKSIEMFAKEVAAPLRAHLKD